MAIDSSSGVGYFAVDSCDLELATRSGTPVLITARSRTERQGCARRIHDNGIHRARPFLEISCDAGRSDLDRCRLSDRNVTFGRLLAPVLGGTLFLDEIGGLSLWRQSQLLALMDSGTLAARIVGGASRSLLEAIAAGAFSEVLFYRLNVIHVWL